MPEIPVTPIFIVLRPSMRPQSIAEQSSDVASTLAEPGAQPRTFEELPRLKLSTSKGVKEFVKAELLNILKKRRAFVWLYGYDLVEIRTRDKYYLYDVRGV